MKRLAVLALVSLLAAACGGERRVAPPPQPPATATARPPAPPSALSTTAPRPPSPPRCATGYRRVGSDRVAYAAVVRGHANAFTVPGGARLAAFGKVNVNDYQTVFGVRGKLVARDCSVRWYRVQLPIRPNGVEGWVRARDVELEPVRTRIEVDLSARRVTLFRSGRRVLTTRAAVGASATPTPTGRFYVNQRLVPDDPAGPFGPGALGISAFSDVLTGWVQGGPIAIHGTNAPWSIGRAVSNGCIRVANRVLTRMFRLALAGTPVVVHA